jgi:hypothetical protein
MRIPILAGYNDRQRQSLRMFIATKVDQIVRKELEDTMSVAAPMQIPMPNVVSNFLYKYSTYRLEETLDDMRETFAEERKTIIGWEGRMRRTHKTGYGEALNIMNEISSSLTALKKTDWSEIVLAIGPRLAKDVVAGTFGLSTAVPFAKDGVNLVRKWAQLSRISYFNNSKKEAANIENQKELLLHVFGNTLTSMQITRFLRLSKSLDNLTQLR